jgi:AcrR family transcriptional regulator
MDKRRQILEAAERVFRAKGLSGATTREIARDAGCAEGTLYLHFHDRLALFRAVLDECLPDVKENLYQLEKAVGKRTVRRNLESLAASVLAFHERVQPTVCSLFAEPELLAAHQKHQREQRKGPRVAETLLGDYIRAEQKLGRIDRHASPEAICSMLLGSCFFRVFVARYTGDDPAVPGDVFVRKLIDNIVRGTRPERKRTGAPLFAVVDASH